METKQILINVKIPSLADTPDGSEETLQILREQALDETMLDIISKIFGCGYDFKEILYALAAYPESQQWQETHRLLEQAASSVRKTFR